MGIPVEVLINCHVIKVFQIIKNITKAQFTMLSFVPVFLQFSILIYYRYLNITRPHLGPKNTPCINI